jgi:DNA-binding IclR family transcriptional regulator
MKPESIPKTNTLQTLDRGLQALKILSMRTGGISVADLAAELSIHRAIAYRLIATLEHHGLIARMRDGRIVTGAGVLRLSATFESQFRALAQSFLYQLAEEASATAFITVAQGDDCTAIQVCEPQMVDFRMSYRVGSRHSISVGAAGIAILAGRPSSSSDTDAVKLARQLGYSITHGELQKGAIGIASAIALNDSSGRLPFEACVGIVAMEDLDTGRCAGLVMACAEKLATTLTSVSPFETFRSA